MASGIWVPSVRGARCCHPRHSLRGPAYERRFSTSRARRIKGNKEAENRWRAIYSAGIREDIVGTDAVASGPTFKREPARHAEELNIASALAAHLTLVSAPPALTYTQTIQVGALFPNCSQLSEIDVTATTIPLRSE